MTDPRDLERPEPVDAIVIEQTGGLDHRPALAPFVTRLLGAAIDGLALTVAVLPGTYLLVGTGDTRIRFLGLILIVLAFFAVNIWYARSVARTGQWLGNRITNTRVVDAVNGQPIDVARAGARFAIRHLVSVILLAGFLSALRDNQRQAFHDKIASSVVVGRSRETWSADDRD